MISILSSRPVGGIGRALALTLLLAFIPALANAALSFPSLSGRVVDAAGIIPEAERAAISAKLVELEDKSGIQLVVATVPSLQDTDVETFANGLFRTWKLGEQKQNNGLLFLIAPTERKVRIEVGYGLEGTMTDALSSVIIQSTVIPRFKAGDFAGGVARGVDAIIGALTVDSAEWQAKARVRTDSSQGTVDDLMPLLIFCLFVFVVITMMRQARGSSGRWVRRGGQTIFIPGPSSGWSGGSSGGFSSGGSWGGGSSGGGGFSGGGGSSGGGGASGSW